MTKTKEEILKEYRLKLDDIFESAHSYTGPNIDETFDMVWKLFQEALDQAEQRGREEVIKRLKTWFEDNFRWGEKIDDNVMVSEQELDDFINKLKNE